VFPPAPEFLFQPPVSYGPKIWKQDTGPERYRRSLYIFRYRSVPYPLLQTFDAPNGDSSCVRRLRSNTPLQALVSLNETTFVESAQALARKTLTEGGRTDADRVSFAFRVWSPARPPTANGRSCSPCFRSNASALPMAGLTLPNLPPARMRRQNTFLQA